MKKIFFCCLLFSALIFTSCNNTPLNVDVSNVIIPPVNVERLEKDLFTIDTSTIEAETKKLQQKYGNYYSIFIRNIVNNGGLSDSSYVYRIKQFISDKDMKNAYADCQKMYPNVDFLNKELTDLYKHFKYYFPKRNLPKPITMMSGFNYTVVNVDSTLAIGLEMYLSEKSIFYQMLGLPKYKTSFMNQENIIPDAARAWMFTEFPFNMNKNDFLSEITYMGKILYLTDALLPNTPDSLKIQYTQQQLDYCIQNEFNVWSYFAAKKMLYTTDHAEIMKYTTDGPFTSAFSKEAPPRIAYWIGWQIVREYMKNNPKITLEELMKEDDAQKILTKAKYKPAK
ncbi:MAG: hypothetical protein WBM13_05105 [Bacteroidia bacterium]